MIFRHFLQFVIRGAFAFVLLYQGVAFAAPDRPAAPEPSSGLKPMQVAEGRRFMAVTAHPEATKTAYDILARGGTAADAGIAAQLVLGLVEPQSSGLGGGGFVLYYDAEKNKLSVLDGRETAPSVAGRHLFTGKDGKPMAFYDAAIGGRAVGVPGIPRLMETLYEAKGKLPWRDLFSPAIRLAEQGFTVSPRLAALLREERNRFTPDVIAKLYFYPDASTPVQAGERLQNPKYAATLRTLAMKGAEAFYTGSMAEEMVVKVREARGGTTGLLSIEDLSGYRAKLRAPVCGGYRGYGVCSVGEPSSGGLTLLIALGILDNFNLRALGSGNPESWHLIAEASRLAFADRNHYMADPDFVNTPGAALLDPAYLKARAALIDPKTPMKDVLPGMPPGWRPDLPQSPDSAVRPPGTTHISIVDSYGNILSMTSSIENAFGSRLMTDGFLLNNQLTDFSFVPERGGAPVANQVQGGKRPRSSMAPVIVYDPKGRPFLVIGSAGGSRIIGYVLQRIIEVIDWDMDIGSALSAPHILNRGRGMEMEKGADDGLAGQLRFLGHPVEVQDMNSGLGAILFQGGKITAAADPRREGTAMGK